MKVKDIVRTCALLLNREDVVGYLDGDSYKKTADTENTVNVLVDLVNLVISELASTYVPAIYSENVMVNDGKVYYKDLKKTALKIVCVTDEQGRTVDFRQHIEFFTVSEDKAIVEYEYLPTTVTIDDEVCYSEKQITKRVLSFGTLAEYAITEGEFEQAVMWHKRYVDGVEAICLPQNKRLKNRRWV